MKQHIILEEGEIFEASLLEGPVLYIGKINPKECYKTLHVIEKI